MFIDISSIKEGKGQSLVFEGEISLAWDGENTDIELISPWDIHAEVTHTDVGYMLVGKAAGEYRVPCDRCLKAVYSRMEIEIADCFVPKVGGSYQGEEECKVFDKDLIDPSETIIESFLLQLPMKHLCAPNCAGLCPQCGQDLNTSPCQCEAPTDPRWERLNQLKDTEGGGRSGQSYK